MGGWSKTESISEHNDRLHSSYKGRVEQPRWVLRRKCYQPASPDLVDCSLGQSGWATPASHLLVPPSTTSLPFNSTPQTPTLNTASVRRKLEEYGELDHMIRHSLTSKLARVRYSTPDEIQRGALPERKLNSAIPLDLLEASFRRRTYCRGYVELPVPETCADFSINHPISSKLRGMSNRPYPHLENVANIPPTRISAANQQGHAQVMAFGIHGDTIREGRTREAVNEEEEDEEPDEAELDCQSHSDESVLSAKHPGASREQAPSQPATTVPPHEADCCVNAPGTLYSCTQSPSRSHPFGSLPHRSASIASQKGDNQRVANWLRQHRANLVDDLVRTRFSGLLRYQSQNQSQNPG